MPLVFGMTIIAGLVEIAIALCLARLRIVITLVISGLAVFIVGLQLGIVGIGQLPRDAAPPRPPPAYAIDNNEEQAVLAGLRTFLESAHDHERAGCARSGRT
jgi:xanthine/uracil permease